MECKVDGRSADCKMLCTHWTLWNKVGDRFVTYELRIPFNEVITKFNDYWTDVLDREQDPQLDDGTELEDIYLELKLANYPSLESMLNSYPNLFRRCVLEDLQTEFIGYIVDGSNGSCIGKEYSLHTIDKFTYSDDKVVLLGRALSL